MNAKAAGGRILGALAVLAVTGAVVATGTRLGPVPLPSVTASAVAVPPAPTTAVCPGPLQQVESSGTASFSSTPVAPVISTAVLALPAAGGALAGTVQPLSGTAALASLTAAAGTATVAGPTGPVVAQIQGGGGPPRLAGTTSVLVTDGDLRGLATAACQAPATDAWLVGGSTAVGSTADLVLVNPGDTTAEVAVQVWGPSGTIALPQSAALVAPHATTVLELGGLAPDQRSLVVHVTATGAQIAAWLQDSALRGYTPDGVALVAPGAAPATRQTIPGVDVEASTGDSPDQPVLRLLAPGTDAASGAAAADGAVASGAGTVPATITLVGADGPVDLAGAGIVPLTAGEVADVPLGGLPAGAYTVVIDSPVPVVAALEFTRIGQAGALDPTARVDRTWAAATVPGGGLAVPAPGADTTLVVGAVAAGDQANATGELTGTLRLLGAGGAVLGTRNVAIDAGSTGVWPLSDLVSDPSQVTGVELLPGSGGSGAAGSGAVTASWALIAQHTQADGVLFGVVLPAPVTTDRGVVVVREDPALGIG